MSGTRNKYSTGWRQAQVPDSYYYQDIPVKRIDRGRGLIELRTDPDHGSISVLELGLEEAMKAFEKKTHRLSTGGK